MTRGKMEERKKGRDEDESHEGRKWGEIENKREVVRNERG